MAWGTQISSFIFHKVLHGHTNSEDLGIIKMSSAHRVLIITREISIPGEGKANKQHGLETALPYLLPSRGLTICNFSGIKPRRQLALLRSVISDWSVQREARLSVGMPQSLSPSFWPARAWIFRCHSSAKNCFSLK